MPSFNFAEKAEADLVNIINYTILKWGVDQANSYIDGLEKQAQLLANRPAIARSVDHLHEGLKAFPYQSHVLYFVETPNGITIARVLHQSMNPALHFDDE